VSEPYFDDHRRRQMQGIAKAKSEGKYRGRLEDKKRNTAIMNMLKRGMSWNSIIEGSSGSGKKLSRRRFKAGRSIKGGCINVCPCRRSARSCFRGQRACSRYSRPNPGQKRDEIPRVERRRTWERPTGAMSMLLLRLPGESPPRPKSGKGALPARELHAVNGLRT
jgi:hypothetical protein